MLVLRLLVKAIKLLNSETAAGSLATAVACGLVLGLVPLLTLQALLVVAGVLFLRVNLTLTLVSMGVWKLVALGLRGPLDGIGVALLETEGLTGVWAALYQSPLAMLDTHHATTLGATLAAVALVLPVWGCTLLGVRAYRRRMSERWAQRAAAGAGQTSWLVRLYTWADAPWGAP